MTKLLIDIIIEKNISRYNYRKKQIFIQNSLTSNDQKSPKKFSIFCL